MTKLTISDVNKKHLRIIAFLVGSWAVALGLAYISENEYLIGLAPVLNYITYALSLELKNEGYRAVK